RQPAALRTQNRVGAPSGLSRVREAARRGKEVQFTSLMHHVSVDQLRESFQALNRKAAPGVDGVTWKDYEAHLEERIRSLHERVQRGTYHALPSRRAYIAKPDGGWRPPEEKSTSSATPTTLSLDSSIAMMPNGFTRNLGNACGRSGCRFIPRKHA